MKNNLSGQKWTQNKQTHTTELVENEIKKRKTKETKLYRFFGFTSRSREKTWVGLNFLEYTFFVMKFTCSDNWTL